MARFTRSAVPALVGLLALVAAAPSAAQTTAARTILDQDRDNRLEYRPGESHVVRADLGPAQPGRDRRRERRFTFVQFTDSHVLDEESPLRVEFLDRLGPPLTSAYRPQEGLTPQVQEQMVRQVRGAAGPIFGRRAEVVMTTGDNTDNTQLNETRWFIDLLDGRTTVDPNSGVPGSCGLPATQRRYDGVRGGGEYYEPDASGPPGPASVDGRGYSPEEAENMAEAQRSNQARDYPGLFEAMNRPFAATGLGVPWYGIFGNHDALVEGNQPRNPAFEAVATGCVKVTQPSPATLAGIQAAAAGAAAQEELLPGLELALGEAAGALANPATFGGTAVTVPSDARRRPLRKAEFIAQHFQTRGTPVGHGFTARNVATGMGNYAFTPRSGLRFVVLDSIAENGGSNGNIDDAQFQWIHQQLLEAEQRRQLVVTFAHHSLRTMDQSPVSPFPPGDQGGDASPNVHFGGDEREACPPTPAAAPTTPGETLRCLFLRHPSVVASVVGHEHISRIAPHERRPGAGPAAGGFWEITTPSHIDWPQQSRLLDLADNRDGTLSIFGTLLDHSSEPNPGSAPAADAGPSRLASISRELAYNDPQADNGEDGRGDARGDRDDRNVELLVRNPYPAGGGDDDDD